MNETVQGASPEAATTVVPDVSADADTTALPGAESAPAKVDPIDPEFASEIENVQKKFNKLTDFRRSAERRAEAAERREQSLLQLLQRDRAEAERPEPEIVPVAAAPGKTLADFGYDELKYNEYQRAEIVRTTRATLQTELQKQQDQERTARQFKSFREREAKFAQGTPDYREVAHYAPINNTVAGLAVRLENGPEVVYYLGKNPETAEQLNALSKEDAAIELGRIEARLVFKREQAPKKAVTTAPPPTPKLEGTDPVVEKDPKDWTEKEFEKWRKKHM